MKGWHKESYRHYLAAKGIKTNRYLARHGVKNNVLFAKKNDPIKRVSNVTPLKDPVTEKGKFWIDEEQQVYIAMGVDASGNYAYAKSYGKAAGQWFPIAKSSKKVTDIRDPEGVKIGENVDEIAVDNVRDRPGAVEIIRKMQLRDQAEGVAKFVGPATMRSEGDLGPRKERMPATDVASDPFRGMVRRAEYIAQLQQKYKSPREAWKAVGDGSVELYSYRSGSGNSVSVTVSKDRLRDLYPELFKKGREGVNLEDPMYDKW